MDTVLFTAVGKLGVHPQGKVDSSCIKMTQGKILFARFSISLVYYLVLSEDVGLTPAQSEYTLLRQLKTWLFKKLSGHHHLMLATS